MRNSYKGLFFRGIALVSLLSLFAMLFGCFSKKVDGTGVEQNSFKSVKLPIPDPAVANIYMWGDEPNQFDSILEEYEKRTKDILNLKLKFHWSPVADYNSNLKLKLAAGVAVDLVFDAPWMSLNAFAEEGNYYILDKYFNNSEYPGLKKAFSEEYLKNNRIKGNLYGVPITRTFGDLAVVYIRKDLRLKYNMQKINSLKDFELYLGNVKRHSDGIIPFIMNNEAAYGALSIISGEFNNIEERNNKGVFGLNITPDIAASVYIKDNKIEQLTLSEEPSSELIKFPEPYNKINYFEYNRVNEWYKDGYIEKDVVSRKDALNQFYMGKAASICWTISQYKDIEGKLKKQVKDADIEMFILDKAQREFKKHVIDTDFRAWNYMCIPVSSNLVDRTMKFFDWLFVDKENHDLFELGIKNKNWIEVGENKYDVPKDLVGAGEYNFPGYQFSWNPTMIRISSNLPEDVYKYLKYQMDESSYYANTFAGFSFNTDPVVNSLSNPEFRKLHRGLLPFYMGMVNNPEVEMENIKKKAMENIQFKEDIRIIKEELRKQLQAFLDSKGLK